MDDSLSIVVLNYNAGPYLESCLRSLREDYDRHRSEVIVVDNGSTDDSSNMVKQRFPWVTLIRSDVNLGAAAGRNLGLQGSKGRIVWFLDSDAEVAEGSATAIKDKFARDPRVGVVGCELKHPHYPSIIDCGASIDRFGFVIPSPFRREELPPFFVAACAMAIRRDLLEKLGGFDERYFIFWEEIDLCWRYRLAGYDIGVARDATVYHHGGLTFTGGNVLGGRYVTSLQRRYLGERNMLATLLKNYSLASLIRILPLYLALLSAEIILACVLLRFPLAWRYLRAVGWNLVQLPETLRLRRIIQRKRRLQDRDLPFDSRLGKWLSFRTVGVPRFVA